MGSSQLSMGHVMLKTQCISSAMIIGLLLGLSGCVTSGSGNHSSSTSADGAQQAHQSSDFNDSKNGSKTTAGITLETKKERVYAHVTTTWGSSQQGDLAIKWIPPVESNCQVTEFVIHKYRKENDSTWAYRTYQSDLHNCKGLWQAKVISRDGQVLSTAEVKAE